jgi:hypothetical protein
LERFLELRKITGLLRDSLTTQRKRSGILNRKKGVLEPTLMSIGSPITF